MIDVEIDPDENLPARHIPTQEQTPAPQEVPALEQKPAEEAPASEPAASEPADQAKAAPGPSGGQGDAAVDETDRQV